MNLTRRTLVLALVSVTLLGGGAVVVGDALVGGPEFVGDTVLADTASDEDGQSALVDEAVVHLDGGDWCAACTDVVDGTDAEPYTVEYVDGGPDVTDDGVARFAPDRGYLRLALDEPLDGDFTLTARLRHEPQEYYAGVVTSEAWQLMAPEGRYVFADGGTHVQSAGETPEAWHTVTVVQAGDRLQLYVDGELVDTTRGADRSSTDAVLIGRRTGGYAFEGAIESVTIHDRSLDTAAVQAMHAEQRAVVPFVYTDRFRSIAGLVVALGALFAAHVECRYRSRRTNPDHYE